MTQNTGLVKHVRDGKLVSIDVYYRSDRGTVRIAKGNNDKDARWRKFLHSSPRSETLIPQGEAKNHRDFVDSLLPRKSNDLLRRGSEEDPLLSERDTSTLNSEDIITLAIISCTSAYMLWASFYKRSKHGRKS